MTRIIEINTKANTVKLYNSTLTAKEKAEYKKKRDLELAKLKLDYEAGRFSWAGNAKQYYESKKKEIEDTYYANLQQ